MRFSVPVALTRPRRPHALIAATLIAFAAGCSDSPTGPRPLPVTVSGFLTNRTGEPIPANSRVVVIWDVSDDESYVFGEGTVDPATNRFTITFDRDVPVEATLGNGNSIGIGFVVLTTDPGLGEGRVPDSYDFSANLIGVTGQHAVIYLNDQPRRFAPDWPSDFRRGYNVGRGVKVPGATFDDFAPTGLDTMELIVDDLENIEIVNWT
jgi:hypothetical protein